MQRKEYPQARTLTYSSSPERIIADAALHPRVTLGWSLKWQSFQLMHQGVE